MKENTNKIEHSLVGETLVSLWHTAFRYDWRALCVTNDTIHLIYLGKPNPLLILLGPFGGIIMQNQARSAYKKATAVPFEQRVNSHPNNMTLQKEDIVSIQGSSSKISITKSDGSASKLIRMGSGNLSTLTADFGSD